MKRILTLIVSILFYLGMVFCACVSNGQNVPLRALGFAQGWVRDDAKAAAFIRTLPLIYATQKETLIAEDDNADALLYRSLAPCLIAEGQENWISDRDRWKVVSAYNQGNVGSCVGNATAAALSVLNGVEVFFKKEHQEFVAMHSADGMYGLARESAGMLGRSDGCTGSGAAKAITQYGTLYCIKYEALDLRTNSPARCRELGRTGVGSKLKLEANDRKVSHVTNARNAREAWSLIGNGYPINVCSNQGFSNKRDAEGRCNPSGSWNHSMAIIGRRTTEKGDRLFLIWNSWGDSWASGPYWQDMPLGSFWADFAVVDKMLKQGDSFAYSGLNGFPPRKLPDFGSREFLAYIYKEHNNDATNSFFVYRNSVGGVFSDQWQLDAVPNRAIRATDRMENTFGVRSGHGLIFTRRWVHPL